MSSPDGPDNTLTTPEIRERYIAMMERFGFTRDSWDQPSITEYRAAYVNPDGTYAPAGPGSFLERQSAEMVARQITLQHPSRPVVVQWRECIDPPWRTFAD